MSFGHGENIYNPYPGSYATDQYGVGHYSNWGNQLYGNEYNNQTFSGQEHNSYSMNITYPDTTTNAILQWGFDSGTSNTMPVSTNTAVTDDVPTTAGQIPYNSAITHTDFCPQFQLGGQNLKPPTTRRKRKINKIQRVAANMRERRRMTHLNAAFEELKEAVPTLPHEKKLSRIQTLKLAMYYIEFMTRTLHGTPYPPFPTTRLTESGLQGAATTNSESFDGYKEWEENIDDEQL
ncbi:neurogenic differentiation factor 2-like [Lingula anatina]|uniref:Neurogenic differentiation factor 2-like n=1 Tax=Lingula anatina TaxID=7574 RepID=A0A1S3IBE0_LINAN|nr:neurogenic differentiation factor 2-like [Lingula anatina]|eukprot:XP_013394729.1 neurogenic differentiation factor 2-like [Lingula anatina]